MSGGCAYIPASERNGTPCAGVIANIAARMQQHREGSGAGFAPSYRVQRLVYIERHDRIEGAIAREKAIKKWKPTWKLKLIEAGNPEWCDLFETLNA